MGSDKFTPRLLGMMFVVVAALSLLSGLMLSSLGLAVVGPPDNISETMINISDNPTTTHVSIVVMLIEAVGIVLLAVLLYTTLKTQNVVVARWAFVLLLIPQIRIRSKSAFPLGYNRSFPRFYWNLG